MAVTKNPRKRKKDIQLKSGGLHKRRSLQNRMLAQIACRSLAQRSVARRVSRLCPKRRSRYLEHSCGNLSRPLFIVGGQSQIPALEYRPERAIKCLRSGLQLQLGAALNSLHLLTFGRTLADGGVDGSVGHAYGSGMRAHRLYLRLTSGGTDATRAFQLQPVVECLNGNVTSVARH